MMVYEEDGSRRQLTKKCFPYVVLADGLFIQLFILTGVS
jgi:hypothetical protein